jgi:hypothetical protein
MDADRQVSPGLKILMSPANNPRQIRCLPMAGLSIHNFFGFVGKLQALPAPEPNEIGKLALLQIL